jgi:hypothetical protein
MICWSEYYPLKLVALLNPNPAQSKKALGEFKRDVVAYWAARGSGNRTLKKLAESCKLNLLFVQWCIAYCASTGWMSVPPPMMELLVATFSGFLQSRIIENANKELRLREHANRSKVGLFVGVRSFYQYVSKPPLPCRAMIGGYIYSCRW